MPNLLRKMPFTEELLAAVQSFDCGGEPWERPLADWIKASPQVHNGALSEIKKRKGKLQVWLHINEQNELVGYSSLGESNWRWPLPDDPRVPISVIPNVAIQRPHWGRPIEPPRYSQQIVEHLMFEALQHTSRQPLLGLYVDPRNTAAIRLYERVGFEPYFQTYTDLSDGVTYHGMLLKLQR